MKLPEMYALETVAKSVKKSLDEVLEICVTLRLNVIKSDEKIFLHRDSLPAFFQHVGKDVVRRSYDLSRSSIITNTAPWARTLESMYREETSCPASLSPQQGEFLRSVLINLNPKRCLEIGCFIGVSTLWISSALEACNDGGMLHSVDFFGDKMPFGNLSYIYHPDSLGYIQTKLDEAGLRQRVQHHVGHSHAIGKRYHELIGDELDFLFIDGDHTYEGCLLDYLLYEPHLKVGGYLVLHDIYPDKCGCQGPRRLIDEVLLSSPSYRLLELHTQPKDYGMALIQKIGKSPKVTFG